MVQETCEFTAIETPETPVSGVFVFLPTYKRGHATLEAIS